MSFSTIENAEDEDNEPVYRNVAPRNKDHVLELADGSDDDDDLPLAAALSSNEENEAATEEDVDMEPEDSEAEESEESELGIVFLLFNEHSLKKVIERLAKDWVSPIYVFFKPKPSIEYINERRVHVFECTVPNCKGKANGRKVRRYLDTSDAKSTSNLRKHAKICWGEEPVAAADATKDVHAAREALGKFKDSSITAAFKRVAKSKVTYSYRQHTTSETR
jgi:hypothetical protein